MRLRMLIIFWLVTAGSTASAQAVEMVWNDDGTYAAYVDYIIAEDHPLADWTTRGKSVFFHDRENDLTYRGTWFPMGWNMGDACWTQEIELIEWIDNETVLVGVTCHCPSMDNVAVALYEIQVDGIIRWAGFDDLHPEARDCINPEYFDEDYTEEFNYLSEAGEIVQFLEDLCSGAIPIDENSVAEEILNNETRELYDSAEDYLGCKDPVQFVMPENEFRYNVWSIWHRYIFDYDADGNLKMIFYSAPEDL